MEKLQELKRRLGSLKRAQVYAKPAAAEECLVCAVELLDEMAARLAAQDSQLRKLKGEK